MGDRTEESAYFYRIITLIVDIGTETLRELFYHCVPKEHVKTVFSDKNIKDDFNKLRVKKILNDDQYKLLVEENPDPDKYDVTLLITLLTIEKISKIKPPAMGWGTTPPSSDLSVGAELLRLREKRNELVGHRHCTQITASDFESLWKEIEDILVRIAGSVSTNVANKIRTKITEARTHVLEPLNDREKKLLCVFLKWRKDEDDRQQARLEELQTSLENLHVKVDGMPKQSLDVTDAARSDDTLSSMQSQVISIAESMGGMSAQVTAVQQIQQNVQNMQVQMMNLQETINRLRQELDAKRKENEQISLEVAQLRQNAASSRRPAGDYRSPQVMYEQQPQPKRSKTTNPNAMSEKEILELSKQIGSEFPQLRIHLDFTEAQYHALKTAYNDSVRERVHVLLKRWHDVVVKCGENPKMLLAAAFINADQNYSMAETLVARGQIDEYASAKQSTIEQIQQIEFCKSGPDLDQRDGSYHHPTGRSSPYGYGGRGAINMYGGEIRIEGALTVQSSLTSTSSNSSMVSSDGSNVSQTSDLHHSGSVNVFDGKLVMAQTSNVMIGPPGSNYTSPGYQGQVRGEVLDFTDSGAATNKGLTASCSSGSIGQPYKKERDETLSQSMVAALHEQMKSVGVIICCNQPVGTVFRVGKSYVMTALHVVRDIIDPERNDDYKAENLETDEVYISFNESAIGAPIVPYRVKKEFIYNSYLDIAVLEIANPKSLPMKMNLSKPKMFAAGTTSVSLVGFGHKDSSKKCLDPKCEILSPNSQKVKSAIAALQQNYGYYKNAITGSYNNEMVAELVDNGYYGYDNPTKMLINCFLEHGASGAPALTNDNERSIEVVGMLTGGLPEFYFKLPKVVQGNFPSQYRFELATKMTSIYDWIKATQPKEIVEDIFG